MDLPFGFSELAQVGMMKNPGLAHPSLLRASYEAVHAMSIITIFTSLFDNQAQSNEETTTWRARPIVKSFRIHQQTILLVKLTHSARGLYAGSEC